MADENCVLYCHVGYDGDRTSEGHIDKLTGYGYEAIRQRAKESGWVDCGNRWCCPACANDPETVAVYRIQDPMFGPPVIYTNKEAAEADFEDWKADLDADEIDRLVFETDTMTRGEVNQLGEFDGY